MLIVLLRDQKYQKSARRTHAVLLPNHWRRARVSRASRAWRVRAIKDKVKIGSFIAPRNLILPRVRTYHTKKPSRFVHALPTRPLKVQGGRGWSKCADGTKSYFLFCLFAVLRLYLVGVGAVDDPRGRVEHCSPAKKHKETFPLSYFCVTKSTIKEPPHILTKSGFRAWYTAISRKPTAFSISFAVPKSAARSRAQCASEPSVIISPPSSR